MKVASFCIKNNDTPLFGVVKDNRVFVPEKSFCDRFPSVRDIIEADAMEELSMACSNTESYDLDSVTMQIPIPNSRRIICAGMNYRKLYPVDGDPPQSENVLLFAKLDGTLVGHNCELEMPTGEAANSYDYEGEIVCVIGKGGRYISPENAFDHIAGFTIMNDGSVRGWQKHSIHAGKNFANSGSCGPWMVTLDDIKVSDLRLETRLNGQIVQSASASEMLFSIQTLISYISHSIDLRSGDMIATGSPEGSGGSKKPPKFLERGDRLAIEVDGIGILRNTVV